MNLEQQLTSLELSKKLKELGVPQESLFYHYYTKNLKAWNIFSIYEDVIRDNDDISAFTVAELGKMLPAGALGAYLNCFKNVDKGWNVGYGLEITFTADNEADTRAKMLIYLLEKKLIAYAPHK